MCVYNHLICICLIPRVDQRNNSSTTLDITYFVHAYCSFIALIKVVPLPHKTFSEADTSYTLPHCSLLSTVYITICRHKRFQVEHGILHLLIQTGTFMALKPSFHLKHLKIPPFVSPGQLLPQFE